MEHHGIRLTQEFVDVAQAATLKIREILKGNDGGHCIDNANWHGEGTVEVHIVPETKGWYLDHKETYDIFWNALRDAGFLKSEPTESQVTIRKVGVKWTMMAVIKGMEVY